MPRNSDQLDPQYRIHTPANYVTFVRIALVPVWLILAELQMSFLSADANPFLAAKLHLDLGSLCWGCARDNTCAALDAYIRALNAHPFAAILAWSTFVLFCLLCLSDKLDGYLARSRNEVTVLGKFLDPIADKILVIVALVFLLEYHATSSWTLLVIVGRELLVSALRMLVASEGKVVAASNLGKAKTATTMAALCGYLVLPLISDCMLVELVGALSTILMALAVVLTLISGVDYVIKSWSVICHDTSES